jgi:hypothetical protein
LYSFYKTSDESKLGENTSTLENSQGVHDKPTKNAHTIVTNIDIRKNLDINIVGNNENQESKRIEEMSTNYVDTCETYRRK